MRQALLVGLLSVVLGFLAAWRSMPVGPSLLWAAATARPPVAATGPPPSYPSFAQALLDALAQEPDFLAVEQARRLLDARPEAAFQVLGADQRARLMARGWPSPGRVRASAPQRLWLALHERMSRP